MVGGVRRVGTARVALVVVVGALASTMLAVTPASAAVSGSAGFTVPFGFAVGSTNLAASVRMTNQNNAPNQAESNTVNEIRFTPSCGSFGSSANPCPLPDIGVFSLSPTGTGAAGTACAGRTFNVSGPDASGSFYFTVVGPPVVLGPPSSGTGPDRCTIDFTMNALRVPQIDASPGEPGVQTVVSARVRMTSTSGLQVSPYVANLTAVSRGIPMLPTQASPSVPVGGSIFDTATVVKPSAGAANPTGTVTFQVFGPNNNTCTGPPVFQSTKPVAANGTSTSAPYVVNLAGVYRFVATYSGDANYESRNSPCNSPGESVVVTSPATDVPADFDGNGTTDFAVFRPATGRWLVKDIANTVFGVSTDIPVPADYTGDGRTDIAVFRPSTGEWFVLGRSPVVWGLSTDIPVPADYTGDNRAEVAVFRPSTGQWFVQGAPTVVLGAAGDTPVPGDYNGDGRTDRAVFRPSTGQWIIAGMPTTVWGVSTDIPVPGDYNDDGRTDIAVFRRSTGQWLIVGQPAVVFGSSGDLPAPGDYNGDGRTDIAVYRRSTGQWLVQGLPGAVWGSGGDIALPLPYAIRRTISMP